MFVTSTDKAVTSTRFGSPDRPPFAQEPTTCACAFERVERADLNQNAATDTQLGLVRI